MYVCICVYSISLLQTLDLAWQACHELDTCEAFVEVLQYILAIGNYLNAGSKQGGAYGFRLTVLPKVGEYPFAAFRNDLLADCKNLTTKFTLQPHSMRYYFHLLCYFTMIGGLQLANHTSFQP